MSSNSTAVIRLIFQRYLINYCYFKIQILDLNTMTETVNITKSI